jgi:hypothetical protein
MNRNENRLTKPLLVAHQINKKKIMKNRLPIVRIMSKIIFIKYFILYIIVAVLENNYSLFFIYKVTGFLELIIYLLYFLIIPIVVFLIWRILIFVFNPKRHNFYLLLLILVPVDYIIYVIISNNSFFNFYPLLNISLLLLINFVWYKFLYQYKQKIN